MQVSFSEALPMLLVKVVACHMLKLSECTCNWNVFQSVYINGRPQLDINNRVYKSFGKFLHLNINTCQLRQSSGFISAKMMMQDFAEFQ